MFASPVVFAAADIDLEVGSLAPGQLLRNLYRCPALRMLHRGIHEHDHAGPLRRSRGAAIGQVAAAPPRRVMGPRPGKAAGRIKISHLKEFGTYCS